MYHRTIQINFTYIYTVGLPGTYSFLFESFFSFDVWGIRSVDGRTVCKLFILFLCHEMMTF